MDVLYDQLFVSDVTHRYFVFNMADLLDQTSVWNISLALVIQQMFQIVVHVKRVTCN